MGQRHRDRDDPGLPKQEVRSKSHGERSRVHGELNQLAKMANNGTEPEDLTEPSVEWKPPHHHDPEVAREMVVKQRRPKRHWKTKFWKRRASMKAAELKRFEEATQGADNPAS